MTRLFAMLARDDIYTSLQIVLVPSLVMLIGATFRFGPIV